MKEFLSKMVGRKVDVSCVGTARLRGEIVKVEGGVLHLRDEEQQICYAALEHITVVREAREDEKRAGFFVSGPPPNER